MILREAGIRGLFVTVLLISASESLAEFYGEYRGDLKFSASDLDQSINHLRVGYRFENNVYVDLGPRNDGTSLEVGYRYNFGDGWAIKGKWEGSDVGNLMHKLETELRYASTRFDGSYIEYKNELKFINSEFDKRVDHLRIGYRFENDAYFEIGPRTDGVSGEVGYKYEFSDAWSWKGKWEANETLGFQHKIEAEIRYRF